MLCRILPKKKSILPKKKVCYVESFDLVELLQLKFCLDKFVLQIFPLSFTTRMDIYEVINRVFYPKRKRES